MIRIAGVFVKVDSVSVSGRNEMPCRRRNASTGVGKTEAEDENLVSHAAKVGNGGRTRRQGSCSQQMSTWPAGRCDLVLLVL